MNKVIYILGICMALGMMSCDDYLDTTPDNRTVLDSSEKVKELLTSAYPEFNYCMFCFSMSDNADDKGMGHTSDIGNAEAYAWKDLTSTSQDTPAGYWDACYAAIAHANQALAYIEKSKINSVIPDEFLPYYGEALLVRSYCHFMLVNIFAKHYDVSTAETDLGIPYVTEIEKVVFKNYKRLSVAQVYNLVEKDLLEGIKYLQDDAYDVAKYHLNTSAANTFASRFYLYKGNWNKVVEYSSLALGSNPSMKIRDLSVKYKTMGLNEQVAQYSKATEVSNFLLSSCVTLWFNYFQATFRYTYSNNIKKEVYNNIFILGDKEWAQSSANYGTNDPVVMKWGYFFKRSGINADLGYFYAMIPTIVAEEALLNRVEANVMLKKYTEAEQDLDVYFSKRIVDYDDTNKVTETKIVEAYKNDSKSASILKPVYDLDDKTRTYLNCVIDTRRREFIYNGLRWFDIKRFSLKVIHRVVDGASIELEEDDLRKVIQIPVSAQQFGLESNKR